MFSGGVFDAAARIGARARFDEVLARGRHHDFAELDEHVGDHPAAQQLLGVFDTPRDRDRLS